MRPRLKNRVEADTSVSAKASVPIARILSILGVTDLPVYIPYPFSLQKAIGISSELAMHSRATSQRGVVSALQ